MRRRPVETRWGGRGGRRQVDVGGSGLSEVQLRKATLGVFRGIPCSLAVTVLEGMRVSGRRELWISVMFWSSADVLIVFSAESGMVSPE